MGAVPSYWSALWTTVSSPAETLASITGGATEAGESASAATPAVGLSPVNVLGYQSQAQKNALVQQESAELQQAGLDQSTAQAQAQSDVTGALLASGTDPSQNPANNILSGVPGNLTDYVFFALVVLAGIALLSVPSVGKYGSIFIAVGGIGAFGEYEGWWILNLSGSGS